MIGFIKGLFGWDPKTERYSTTETLSIILVFLVVGVTIYLLLFPSHFQYYTDLLMYAVGGASGNKIAKGIATTVQSFRKEGGSEDENSN